MDFNALYMENVLVISAWLLYILMVNNILSSYMYKICNDQIRIVNITNTSTMYHFFVVRTFKFLSSIYFEIHTSVNFSHSIV